MKYLISLIPLFFLSGCAVFDSFQGDLAEGVADIIAEYCAETDLDARQQFRDDINARLADGGHSIEVTCGG